MKRVLQYRFGNNDIQPNNSDEQINATNLINGGIFANHVPIIQLGIQTLPGVKFYINGSDEPIIIGVTGVFELDCTAGTYITALRFEKASVEMINGTPSAYLIVDTIYEEEEDD